ncbi:MAG: FAD-dependent oxidoreductase, partial [Bacteroidaceae bacterium]|nr:FAD-dependent oxidoreductase [Bacteroidaceae bacterium]
DGGNAAVEEGMYLTKFAKKVYIIHRRDELRADKIVQERAFANDKVEFVLSHIPLEIKGTNTVENIVLQDVKTNEIKELKVDGVFPYIGFSPNVDYINGQLKQNQQGFIETDVNMQTSIEGVYAAGDVRNTPLRQVITAAADGAIAACAAVKYIEEKTPLKV